MNKEQAKMLIESESLLRQQSKNMISRKEQPVSDVRYGEDLKAKKNEPDDKGDMFDPQLYRASDHNQRSYSLFAGPGAKAKGPVTVSEKNDEKEGKLPKNKFNKKVSRKERFEIKADTKNKRFIVAQDKDSDLLTVSKSNDARYSEEELKVKAYFIGRLKNRTAPRDEPDEDDVTVVKKARVRRVKAGQRLVKYPAIMLDSVKYHVNDSKPGNERIQEDTADKTVRIAKFGIRSTSRRFLPNVAGPFKKSIVTDMDMRLQERKAHKRFIDLRKKDEQIFYDMKLALSKKIVSKVKQIARRNQIGTIIAAICLAFILSAIASAGILAEGVSQAAGSYLSGLSLSTDFDMTDCENYYTKMEADLQDVLDNIEEYYPGFDRYIIDFDDEIGHDPYKLMAFLSAVYEGYDLSLIKPVLNELFNDMYMVETKVETVVENDEEVKIFSIKIVKSSWENLMAERISYDDKDLYDSYENSGGGHQAFHNPFNINWSDKVTSEFGWRIHPISGKEKFHRGVDIAIPSGTPIKSCSEGIVIKSTYSDTEGNYVVVEDESGYRCHYMHLSERNVNEGDTVDYNTVIGKVGSTGYSTGPHLHLQITDDSGECLNPRFMVQGGN